MPYFVYKITEGPTDLVKNLDKLADFDSFKEAKNHARELRTQADNTESNIKVIFADNELHAEELLMEKRDQPILREWEK